jgi:DNA-binding ferritin-like protein (Dps family)
MAENLDETKKKILETSQIVENTLQSIASQIGDIFQDALSEADSITKIFGKDIEKQLRSLARSTDKMVENQLKINAGQASSKDITKQILEYETKREILEKRINNLMGEQPELAAELAEQLKDVDTANDDYISGLIEQRKELERIESKMGVLGKLVKGLNKIPVLGNLIDADKVEIAMKKAAANGTSPFIAGFSAVGKSIKSNLLDPLTIFTFILKQALKANEQTVALGKALGTSSEQYRENLASAARSSNNINVTTANQVAAFNELAQATGFAYEFNTDQLETQIKLTKQVGLQADEAANVQKFAILTGKTSEETYKSFVSGLTSARNQLKVGINFKATLAEALKVSGQLSANLGNDPIRIAKAVVQAKAFGMTLEQTAKTSESLLDFGSSIENELKAELLTGKQLNLERARAAALAGDQATVAEEIAKNIGTAADFTKMNVLQQKSLAESVGMTADQLADTLKNREQAIASGKSLAQVTEEEAAKALERQNIQDKFNAAVLKLQDFFGNLVAGPVGGFLDMLIKSLDVLTAIAGVFGTIYVINKGIAAIEALKYGYAVGSRAMELGKNGILIARQAILGGELTKAIGIAAAYAIANPIMAAVGLALAAGVGALVYSQMDDGIIGPGGETVVSGPKGSIQLNKNDSIVAGTDLFSKGKEKEGTITPSIDLTPMISAINEVTSAVNRLYSKDTSISMDGKKVGTTLTQGSYKVA